MKSRKVGDCLSRNPNRKASISEERPSRMRSVQTANLLKIAAIATLSLCVLNSNALSEEDVREMYEKGMAYAQAGEVDSAIQHFEDIVQKTPNPLLYNALGVCYLQKEGAYRKAVNAFNQAIAMDPVYTEPYFNLGLTYAGQGKDVTKAEQSFRKTVEIDPKFARGYASLGWLYLNEKHEVEKCVRFFRKATRLAPEDASSWYGMGLAYALQGKRERVLVPISRLRAENREDLASNLEQFLAEKEKAESPPEQTEYAQESGQLPFNP